MVRSIVGNRVRQRRREKGMTQVELARRIGISPSYLNLIEWNKRQIAGPLLGKLARELELDELDAVSERRLLELLREIAHWPSLARLGIEVERTGELIGRFPGWARCVSALAHSEREAVSRVRTLTDRLSNDPFLGEAVHRMLSRVAAIRSASEILAEYPDAPAERRDRFHEIIHAESQELSDAGEALAAYLDKAEETDRLLTPLDEVEAFFEARGNRLDELDEAAGALAPELGDADPQSRQVGARELVDAQLHDAIGNVVRSDPRIRTAAGAERARRALSEYAALAALMPALVDAPKAATDGLSAIGRPDFVVRRDCQRSENTDVLRQRQGRSEGVRPPALCVPCRIRMRVPPLSTAVLSPLEGEEGLRQSPSPNRRNSLVSTLNPWPKASRFQRRRSFSVFPHCPVRPAGQTSVTTVPMRLA